MNEEEYKKSLVDAGVELPEVKETKVEEPIEPEPQPEAEKPKEEPLQEHKRSIYDEYKEKKAELKSEKELREQAEQERDELKAKLEAVQNAGTKEERAEAQSELEEFAQEIGADPTALEKMRQLFLKDVSIPKPDESLKKDLEEFKNWKTQNQQLLTQQAFEKEYTATLPAIKELFPNVSQDELDTLRVEIDKLAHSKEWHDKTLDYVVFKNKETLKDFVSPKKRGMESKGRQDNAEIITDFDPNADFSKMSLKQRENWEKEYNEAIERSKGIVKDAQGKTILL